MTLTLTRADEDAPLREGPITVLRTQLEQRADEFRMVLPAHIKPDRFQRTVLTAAQANPDLLKCDRRSLLTACMKAAQDALLPDGREAAIVPFNTRMKVDGEWKWVRLAQYMPMVYGLRKKILQSGEITDIFAAVVYRQEIDGERFIYEEGSERTLRHKPILDPEFKPTDADIAAVYSVATFNSGFKSFEVMRRYEINEVRESSQTGAEFDAKGEPRDSKGPWVDWFSEMAKKTVIRRHSKSLPQSGDIILSDVEAEDMAFASRSAIALLDAHKADAPKPAEPPNLDGALEYEAAIERGEIIDKDTGEVIAKSNSQKLTAETTDNNRPEPDPAPEPEPKPDPTPEPEADPTPEPEPDISAGAVEAEQDEMGVTKTGDDDLADEYIARARKCELLADLRKLEREADAALAEMPVEIAAIVDGEFAAAKRRLTPVKQK